MRITSPEDLALSFQGCPVAPHNQDGPSTTITAPDDNTTIHVANKQSAGAPPSPRPNRLKIFHRRTSSAPVLARSCSFYVGPRPTGLDGCPLKGCLKKPTRSTHSSFGDESVRSSSGHKVSFSHVQLREYNRQVGDNPTVSSGCPLAIGWKFNKRGKLDIDTYEADRDKDPVPCERLSSKQREKLLSEVGGHSQRQIMEGQVNAYFGRQLRAETLDQIGGLRNYKSIGPRERLFIMRESAVRKFDRAKKGISHTLEQQKLWDDAHEQARRKSLDGNSQKIP